MMSAALMPIIVEIFKDAAVIAATMALASKGINIIIKAFSRGEIVV